jgi:hypothetical protein
MKKTWISLLVIFTLLTQDKIIFGEVRDASTNQPIPNVYIFIKNSDIYAETDNKGSFVLKSVSDKKAVLFFEHVAYGNIEKEVIILQPAAKIITYLLSSANMQEPVIVTTKQEPEILNTLNPVSFSSIQMKKVSRSAGAEGDFQRILRVLPCVSDMGDFSNDMIVRGGNSSENSFFVDGIELPDVNHFSRPGTSGGFMSVIDQDFIQKVDFYAGGFSANYGNALSSVTHVQLKEGRSDAIHGKLGLSYMGAEVALEGPLSENTTFFFTGSRSFADPAMGEGEAFIMAQAQGKITFYLSENAKLSVLNFFNANKLGVDLNNYSDGAPRKAYNYTKTHNTSGLNFKYYINSYQWISFASSFTFLNNGMETSFSRANHIFFNYSSQQKIINSNFSHNIEVGNFLSLDYGVEAKSDQTENSYYFNETKTEVLNQVNKKSITAFSNFLYDITKHSNIRVGVRTEYLTENKKIYVLPRVSYTMNFSEDWQVCLAVGEYTQTTPHAFSLQKKHQMPVIESLHYILSSKHILNENLKLKIETYYKDYKNLLIAIERPEELLIDQTANFSELIPVQDVSTKGKGYSTGIEFFSEYDFLNKFQATLSLAITKSQYRDLNGNWRDRSFDNQFSINTGAIYNCDTWSISANWRLNGGRPFTPYDLEESKKNGETLNSEMTNKMRMPVYHSLNLRIDKRFKFGLHSFDMYLSIWNLYNHKNINNYYWNESTKQVERDNQFPFTPWLGMKYNF